MKYKISEEDFFYKNCSKFFFSFVSFNVIFSLLTFESSYFILFMKEIGFSKASIGIILSLFPLCGVFAPFYLKFISIFGLKKSFIIGYLLRKFVFTLIIFTPVISKNFGSKLSFCYFLILIFLFCILRAYAETAALPWQQFFIPNQIRGKISSISNTIVLITAIIVILISSIIMGKNFDHQIYNFIVIFACVSGLIGVMFMTKVPNEKIYNFKFRKNSNRDYVNALKNKNFIIYLTGSSLIALATTPILGFVPLFLVEIVEIQTGSSIKYDLFLLVGSSLSNLFIMNIIDKVNSKKLILSFIYINLIVPLLWFLTSYYQFIYLYLFYFLYFLQGFSSCIIILVSNKICFNNIIPKSNSAEYSSIYYACVGLFGGLSPFIIGQIFDMLSNPYEVIFLYSFIFFISASYFFYKLNYESRQDYQGNVINDNIVRRVST